jgi:hypothetical protein
VQSVEEAFAVADVLGIVEGLDIRHHPLIGKRLLAVLVRNLDISLAIHQILDNVRCRRLSLARQVQ